MDQPDLLGIGRQCQHSECQQLDFLPFQCQGCKRTFCLDHRKAESHSCPSSQGTDLDVVVIVCPLCGSGIRTSSSEDPNITFEKHTHSGECDPENYQKVHKKKKCPVPGCRQRLTTINVFCCKDCHVEVCLKHRLASDHSCPGPQTLRQSTAAQRMKNTFRGLFSNTNANAATNTTTRTNSIPKKTGGPPPAMPQQQQSLKSQVVAYRKKHSSAHQSNGTEVCPQCNAHFGSVQQLIDHASTAHQNGWASGPVAATGSTEVCPHCGEGFVDPVALVNHVENRHSSIFNKECILS